MSLLRKTISSFVTTNYVLEIPFLNNVKNLDWELNIMSESLFLELNSCAIEARNTRRDGDKDKAYNVVKSYLDKYYETPPLPIATPTELNKIIYNIAYQQIPKKALDNWENFSSLCSSYFPYENFLMIKTGFERGLCISKNDISGTKIHHKGSYSFYDGWIFEFPNLKLNNIEPDINPGGINHGRKSPITKFILVEENKFDFEEPVRAFATSLTDNFNSIRQLFNDNGTLSSIRIGEIKETKDRIHGVYTPHNFIMDLTGMLPPPDSQLEIYMDGEDFLKALFAKRS
jgi:hypothetical protein